MSQYRAKEDRHAPYLDEYEATTQAKASQCRKGWNGRVQEKLLKAATWAGFQKKRSVPSRREGTCISETRTSPEATEKSPHVLREWLELQGECGGDEEKEAPQEGGDQEAGWTFGTSGNIRGLQAGHSTWGFQDDYAGGDWRMNRRTPSLAVGPTIQMRS